MISTFKVGEFKAFILFLFDKYIWLQPFSNIEIHSILCFHRQAAAKALLSGLKPKKKSTKKSKEGKDGKDGKDTKDDEEVAKPADS